MVTQQSATDGVSAGLETPSAECFYQWLVAMLHLSQGDRKTKVSLNKCPQGQLFGSKSFCRTELTAGLTDWGWSSSESERRIRREVRREKQWRSRQKGVEGETKTNNGREEVQSYSREIKRQGVKASLRQLMRDWGEDGEQKGK